METVVSFEKLYREVNTESMRVHLMNLNKLDSSLLKTRLHNYCKEFLDNYYRVAEGYGLRLDLAYSLYIKDENAVVQFRLGKLRVGASDLVLRVSYKYKTYWEDFELELTKLVQEVLNYIIVSKKLNLINEYLKENTKKVISSYDVSFVIDEEHGVSRISKEQLLLGLTLKSVDNLYYLLLNTRDCTTEKQKYEDYLLFMQDYVAILSKPNVLFAIHSMGKVLVSYLSGGVSNKQLRYTVQYLKKIYTLSLDSLKRRNKLARASELSEDGSVMTLYYGNQKEQSVEVSFNTDTLMLVGNCA